MGVLRRLESGVGMNQLVEVEPGQLRPWTVLTPKQRRQATAMPKRKQRGFRRHVEICQEIQDLLAAALAKTGGEPVDGPDASDVPCMTTIIETGHAPDPDLILLPVLERELEALEQWRHELSAFGS